MLKKIFLFLIVGLLSACVTAELKSPCPNFGLHCLKAPVNSVK